MIRYPGSYGDQVPVALPIHLGTLTTLTTLLDRKLITNETDNFDQRISNICNQLNSGPGIYGTVHTLHFTIVACARSCMWWWSVAALMVRSRNTGILINVAAAGGCEFHDLVTLTTTVVLIIVEVLYFGIIITAVNQKE